MGTFDFDVAIIGGGPAGSSLAIELTREGVDVIVLEKEKMPRRKLCGEFMSTEVAGLCDRLGVLDEIRNVGAQPIRSAYISGPTGPGLSLDLPGMALGLSRHTFDRLLFERASDVGAEMHDQTKVESIEGSLDSGFVVSTSSHSFKARIAVGAYGRRASLDRKLGRPSLYAASPFVAFKAHFSGQLPREHIEIYTFPGGYCGLLVEEEGRINVCWMIHQERLKQVGGSPDALFKEMGNWNPRLGRRLESFTPEEEFMAVSRLSFHRRELFAGGVCMIGDAAGMIAPLCGDGIGMALQSARVAASPIIRMLSRNASEGQFRLEYTRAWRREFDMRMTAGRLLQAMFIRPRLMQTGLALARTFPSTAAGVVALTRG